MREVMLESPINYEQKCCVSFVLDVSGSMSGTPIDELNKGIQLFHEQILNDSTAANRLEVSIVTFGSTVDTIVQPSLVTNFSMPTLSTNGTTKLVDGVREGIRVVKERKKWYKDTGQPYYRSWVILITDGDPDAGQDVDGLRADINQGIKSKDFHFFAIGVQGANMKTLAHISSPDWPPASLKGLDFSSFFKWLSVSLGSSGVTGSKDGDTLKLTDPGIWMNGVPVS